MRKMGTEKSCEFAKTKKNFYISDCNMLFSGRYAAHSVRNHLVDRWLGAFAVFECPRGRRG